MKFVKVREFQQEIVLTTALQLCSVPEYQLGLHQPLHSHCTAPALANLQIGAGDKDAAGRGCKVASAAIINKVIQLRPFPLQHLHILCTFTAECDLMSHQDFKFFSYFHCFIQIPTDISIFMVDLTSFKCFHGVKRSSFVVREVIFHQ